MPPPPLRQLFSKIRSRCPGYLAANSILGPDSQCSDFYVSVFFRSALFFIVNRLRFDYTGCCAEIIFVFCGFVIISIDYLLTGWGVN